jgi:preprotein translocase subunit SecF
MIDLVGNRNKWFLLSFLLLLPGLISLAVFGLKFGIDFTGGTSWELEAPNPVTVAEVREVLAEHGHGESIVQIADGTTILIRMSSIDEGSDEKNAIFQSFREAFGEDIEELSMTTVGPSVGNAVRNRSLYAVGLASIGILLYIAFAFRNTTKPLLYGTAAIVSMLHDLLIVIGLFSILGWTMDVEIDALFVTAMLTIMGFSVHDTIVIFDRIRENQALGAAPNFEETVNYSIVQTLVRSLNTSITVVLTLAALYLFGGESTRWFVLALLVGIVVGTYSSIFNGAQLLVAWENGEIQRFFTFGRKGHRQPAEQTTGVHRP